MTDRETAQAAINGLIAKQGITGSVTPESLATQRLQVMLDSSAMADEVNLVTENVNELVAVENAKDKLQLLAGMAGGRLFVLELQTG